MAWMTISLSDTGKRFNREWIFRHANIQFYSGQAYAITGPNGSGKSTLLQTIGGIMQPSEGKIEFLNGKPAMPDDQVFDSISFCAPYMDVIEEMTLTEFLSFHSHFKSWIRDLTPAQIISILSLQDAAEKQIRYFSSGMKQRVKLAQAILSATDAVLLDEPCSNLDESGIALYHRLVSDYCDDRIVIVCSNDPVEYSFCEEKISILDFK